MMFVDAIHVYTEKGGKHGKLGAKIFLRQMTAYEWCMKVGVALTQPFPPIEWTIAKRTKKLGLWKKGPYDGYKKKF